MIVHVRVGVEVLRIIAPVAARDHSPTFQVLMPTRRIRKSPRIRPQQSRAKATVACILDGMIRVLEQEGLHGATTTRIAEAAGVSVGTLYQYFQDRDDILGALQEREFERATSMMQDVLGGAVGASGRQIARGIIEGLLQLYAASPALHRVLTVEGLRVTPTEDVKAFDLRMIDTIRGFLSLADLNVRRPELGVAAFVAYQSVRACMLGRLLESPSGFTDRMLVDELTELVVRYLINE